MSVAERLAPIATGRWADAATALATLVGLGFGVVSPPAALVGAVLLGLVAPTVRRALVTGLYLGGLLVAALVILGGGPDALASLSVLGRDVELAPAATATVVLVAPAIVAAVVRGLLAGIDRLGGDHGG